MTSRYEVHVFKEYLKFSAAHFIATRAFASRCTGTTTRCRCASRPSSARDGYVLDFGLVKAAVASSARSSTSACSCRSRAIA